MFSHFRPRILALLTGGFLAVCASPVQANVNLEWRPPFQAAVVGGIVEIGLYAVSDDETDQLISIVGVADVDVARHALSHRTAQETIHRHIQCLPFDVP